MTVWKYFRLLKKTKKTLKTRTQIAYVDGNIGNYPAPTTFMGVNCRDFCRCYSISDHLCGVHNHLREHAEVANKCTPFQNKGGWKVRGEHLLTKFVQSLRACGFHKWQSIRLNDTTLSFWSRGSFWPSCQRVSFLVHYFCLTCYSIVR